MNFEYINKAVKKTNEKEGEYPHYNTETKVNFRGIQ